MLHFVGILATLALPWPKERSAPNRAAQHEEDPAEVRSRAYADLELSGQVIKWTAVDEAGIQAMQEARERITGLREGKRIKEGHWPFHTGGLNLPHPLFVSRCTAR